MGACAVQSNFRFFPAGVAGAFACFLFLAACDSKAHDEDKEKSRTLILYLTRTTDVFGICVREETASYACGNAAVGYGSVAAYAVAAIQPTYGVTIPAPQGINEICSVLPGASFFSKFSDGAKICQFKCSQTYWEEKKAAGLCTAANYTGLVSGVVTGTTACVNQCFVTGTTVYP